jgi:hypothetical protein
VVSDTILFFWYVQLEWFGLDGKIDARFLILVHVILELSFTQFIEGDDNQSHKDVDKEKWEDDKKDYVKNGHLDTKPWLGTFIVIR